MTIVYMGRKSEDKPDSHEKTKNVIVMGRNHRVTRKVRMTIHDILREEFKHGHQLFSDILPQNSWQGQRCFIVGGGPSLKGFNFSTLKDELTIGINRAYEKFDPTICHWVDSRFWGWAENGEFGEEAQRKFKNSKLCKVALQSTGFPYPSDVFQVPMVRHQDFSTNLRSGLACGDNAGYSALNMAVLLGANPIYLLGFDMYGEKGLQVNWHSGYKDKQPARNYVDYVKNFEGALTYLKAHKVQVINLSRHSKLKYFPVKEYASVKPLTKKQDCYVEGYYGIGDNFYQRPFIKTLSKKYRTVYLRTPTPEIYWDMDNVKFVKPKTDLRTQKKHMELHNHDWIKVPKDLKPIKMYPYWKGYQTGRGVMDSYGLCIPRERGSSKFPVPKAWKIKAMEVLRKAGIDTSLDTICLVHQPTIRSEWSYVSRDPKIEYFQHLINKYKDRYHFISVASLALEEKYSDSPLYGIDTRFDHGELDLLTLWGLMYLANMMICGPSMYMVASIAIQGCDTFIIYGGSHRPRLLTYYGYDFERLGYVTPKPFCGCLQNSHGCNKDISIERLDKRFKNLMDGYPGRKLWDSK